MDRPFQFPGRIRSFKFAFVGIWTMLKSQLVLGPYLLELMKT